MSKLVICEKPSVAKSIASALGVTSRADGYFEGGGWLISWCIGHLVGLADAAAYDDRYKKWRYEDLPILPAPFHYVVSEEKADQFHILRSLMERPDVTELVNACDAGREGELIFRLVYEAAGCSKPFSRLWISSMEDAAIREGFADLHPGADYDPLYQSALCRQKADWLIGINASRLFSVLYHRTLNIGRVQTPTLAMLADRDSKIVLFRKEKYHYVRLALEGAEAVSDRIVSPEDAQAIRDACDGQRAVCVSLVREKKTENPPKLYDLTTLQREANRVFGYTAKQTLDYAQSLYEKKLTTYPRTDCRYLPEEQFSDAARIITALSGVSGLEAVTAKADSALKGPVWDTKKITAHHAIIPTGEEPRSLTAQEKELYLMIAVQYFLQFYPPMLYEAQKILATIVETAWEARGRMIIEPGWTGFAAEEDDEDAKKKEAEQSLPSVGNNDAVLCADVDALKKKTTPPSKFSEGSLIEAMASIHRFVSDAKAKAVLKENEGIGTEATRASILETLKGRGFITASGKSSDKALSTAWKRGFDAILDEYFGRMPETFTYEGKEYTPRSFAASLPIDMDDYIDITSFTHHPFYTQFIIEIPDNWMWGTVYNLPLDEMMTVIDNALANGYPVSWGTDVSEKGFSRTKAIGIIPEADLANMDGTEAERWGKLTQKEKDDALYKFDKPGKELRITQEMRQQAFDNYETTDDHGMVIMGTATDQAGNRYFKVQNSWDVRPPYDGFWYFSRPFVEYKTTSIMVNKNALPKETAKRLGLK